jgi:hypothetical protein
LLLLLLARRWVGGAGWLGLDFDFDLIAGLAVCLFGCLVVYLG